MKNIAVLLILLFTSSFMLQAQKKEAKKDLKESIYLKFKKDAQPLVLLDGKKFDFPIEILDQSKIESVSVLKGEAAMKKYKAPNGVVIIVTKEGAKKNKSLVKIRKSGTEIFSNSAKPLVIINGKVASEKALKKLKKEEIKSIDILKEKAAKEKYNADNGVVIVTTKKKKKS